MCAGILRGRVAGAVLLAIMTIANALPAAAQGEVEERIVALEATARNIDFVWTLVAAALVLLMQAGFLLLEAGMVRSKNSINVAQKNLLDFVVSVIVFALVGFMIAFGRSDMFPVGSDARTFMLSELTPWEYAFFVFQVMFCGTAATIVSGAVAERMKLTAYVLCTALMAGLVYPVFVHWAWGAALFNNDSAFLSGMGFVDFAGSTVVHATGAWFALAACLIMGPRIGRFREDGTPVRIHGHSSVLATTGCLLLFVGWIGFNGGSTTAGTPDIAHIIANTVLAAGTGAAAGYFISLLQEGRIAPEKTISGMLGGLVAITAGCAVLEAQGAMIMGVLGGGIAVLSNWWLENRLRVDDAVGAVGVHGFAGVVGTICLVFLAPIGNLPAGDRLLQLQVQSIGVGINFLWSFFLGLAFFYALDRILPIRVSARDEEKGLNEAEHGTRLGIGHVEEALSSLVHGTADLNMRLPIDEGDEAEVLTRLFNELMDNIQSEEFSRVTAAEAARSAEEAERLSALANSAFEAIVISVDGRIVDGNRALEELLCLPLSELKSRQLREFFDPADWPRLEQEFANSETSLFEAGVIDSKGNAIPVEYRGREIVYRGKTTRVSAVSDLRERKKAEARIRHLAHHDPLTDLPNRAVFQERLNRAVANCERTGSKLAVLLLDLDRFKDINDLYGHPAGDAVIRETAARLKSVLRGNDTVARLGGDEFGIIQMDVEFSNQSADLAHRLIVHLSRPIDTGNGIVVRGGASIGVALCPEDGHTADEIITKADTALYQAKKDGRNTYFLFEEGMDADIKRRRLLEADLAEAIENEDFLLHFQPQVELATARVCSFEALLRWNHPEKGMVNPTDFIPLAEESGKIIRLGEWVLQNACETAKRLPGARRVSVNVSPVQFRDKSFIQRVRAILDEAKVAPERIEIEVTESVLIDDDTRALRMLQDLKAIGLRVVLDDFGTGYSSLSYLSRFPFDQIKIDRSFVHSMWDSDGARSIIQTIIRLGRSFNMEIVAEGVESIRDINFLRQQGCDIVQGFYFGKPAPLDELPSDLSIAALMLSAADHDKSPRHAGTGGRDARRAAPAGGRKK